jgi:hypothetical protein
LSWRNYALSPKKPKDIIVEDEIVGPEPCRVCGELWPEDVLLDGICPECPDLEDQEDDNEDRSCR